MSVKSGAIGSAILLEDLIGGLLPPSVLPLRRKHDVGTGLRSNLPGARWLVMVCTRPVAAFNLYTEIAACQRSCRNTLGSCLS